jgi:hypothetical protein
MKGHIGDRVVLENVHLGDRRRVGVILELRHPDGTPPYLVRWLDDGHEALVFPGPESRVEPPTGTPHADCLRGPSADPETTGL